LAIFSIYFGYITKDIFIGLGSGFFQDNSIFIHPLHEILIDTEFAVPTLFKLLPLFLTVISTILCIVYFEYLPHTINGFKLSKLGRNIYGFFNQRFLIEYFYNKFIVNMVLELGGQTTAILDKGSIEYIGPYGLEKALIKLSKDFNTLNTSIVTDYALYITISFILYNIIFTLNYNINFSEIILILSLVYYKYK
jgi:NADH-ubiquinone oxidoreductase chain 5